MMEWSEEDGNDGEPARVSEEGAVAAPDVDGGSSARSITLGRAA